MHRGTGSHGNLVGWSTQRSKMWSLTAKGSVSVLQVRCEVGAGHRKQPEAGGRRQVTEQ